MDDVRGLFLRMPHGTTIKNKNRQNTIKQVSEWAAMFQMVATQQPKRLQIALSMASLIFQKRFTETGSYKHNSLQIAHLLKYSKNKLNNLR